MIFRNIWTLCYTLLILLECETGCNSMFLLLLRRKLYFSGRKVRDCQCFSIYLCTYFGILRRRNNTLKTRLSRKYHHSKVRGCRFVSRSEHSSNHGAPAVEAASPSYECFYWFNQINTSQNSMESCQSEQPKELILTASDRQQGGKWNCFCWEDLLNW